MASGFAVKNAVNGLDKFVILGYVRQGMTSRYGSYVEPGPVDLEGYGKLSVAEAPERPDEDSYGDQHTGIVVKVERENGAETFYRVDMTLDSYGSYPEIESDPYEVTPKQVAVTRFERV